MPQKFKINIPVKNIPKDTHKTAAILLINIFLDLSFYSKRRKKPVLVYFFLNVFYFFFNNFFGFGESFTELYENFVFSGRELSFGLFFF